jgi:hypothetical protein
MLSNPSRLLRPAATLASVTSHSPRYTLLSTLPSRFGATSPSTKAAAAAYAFTAFFASSTPSLTLPTASSTLEPTGCFFSLPPRYQ